MKSITNYINEDKGGITQRGRERKGFVMPNSKHRKMRVKRTDPNFKEFRAFKTDFENRWSDAIKEFNEIVESAKKLNAYVWMTDGEGHHEYDYDKIIEYEFKNITKDVEETFVSVNVRISSSDLDSEETMYRISSTIDEEPYYSPFWDDEDRMGKTIWSIEYITTPNELIELAHNIIKAEKNYL